MKTILTSIFLSAAILSNAQTTFYKTDGCKLKVIGEQTTLQFTGQDTLLKPTKVDEQKIAGTLIASLLPSIIDLGFKISSDLIEKNLKKYTNEFSARNAFLNTKECYISGFNVKREVLTKGEMVKNDAFNMSVVPVRVDDKTFVFAVKEMSTAISGAKTKKGFNNDYAIEIKMAYYNGTEKKEQSSNPMVISSLNFNSNNSSKNQNANTYLCVSDKFPINADYDVSEISIKIIETNAAKVRAEKIKASYDKYSDDAKEGVKNILNFYIEKSKTEGDGKSETQSETKPESAEKKPENKPVKGA